jgi:tRNA splicing endonuclease
MARIVIKESEIRQYVRSLIREARKSLGYHPTIENGTFNLDKELTMPGARSFFANYFDKDHPAPRKVRGDGVPDRIINFNTKELANKQEIDQFLANRRLDAAAHRNEMEKARYFGKKLMNSEDGQSDRNIALSHLNDVDIDTDANDDGEDAWLNNDDYTKRMLALSVEEREALAQQIIRQRVADQAAKADQEAKARRDALPQTWNVPTEKSTREHLRDLEQQLEALGPRNDINDKKYRELEYIIKKTKQQLNQFYKGRKLNRKQDDIDKITQDALNVDLSNEEEFKDVDPHSIETDSSDETYIPYELQPRDDDDNNRSHYRDFKSLENNGYFSDDEVDKYFGA